MVWDIIPKGRIFENALMRVDKFIACQDKKINKIEFFIDRKVTIKSTFY